MSFFRKKKKQRPTSSNWESNNNFFEPSIQTKLKVGKAGDPFEKEADAVADKVVNNSSEASIQNMDESKEVQKKPISETITPLVQKAESEEEPVQQSSEEEGVQMMEEEEAVQTKEDEEAQAKEEEEVQAKGLNQLKSPSVEKELKASKGKGSPMNDDINTFMSNQFGADFSNVKIHTDEQAVTMNKNLGAKAFANGKDIYFNKGQYNPRTQEGKHLLAHELTHTIQQGAIENTAKNNIKSGHAPSQVQKQSDSSHGGQADARAYHDYNATNFIITHDGPRNFPLEATPLPEEYNGYGYRYLFDERTGTLYKQILVHQDRPTSDPDVDSNGPVVVVENRDVCIENLCGKGILHENGDVEIIAADGSHWFRRLSLFEMKPETLLRYSFGDQLFEAEDGYQIPFNADREIGKINTLGESNAGEGL